jgi:predicted Ser/Thr protein kinase
VRFVTSAVFGKYEIIRRLAVGGMGEIFLARQTGVAGFDRLAILKSLLPDLAEDASFVEQFLDEARVAATLNHPNIIQIFEVGLWNGVYFIAMEYIEGENLSVLLKAMQQKHRTVPYPVTARIIHDAALALDHAHKATDVQGTPLNIVHRDISHQNIMVRSDGVTKVVDFGIAKAANRATRTATGMLKGKFAYMSPEQALVHDVDHRSDQFALGVVLWELLTCKRLFEAPNELMTLKKITSEPIPLPSSVARSVPLHLEATATRMLERTPERRFPSCAEVADALNEYMMTCTPASQVQGVAAFVKDVVGAQIKERTLDLTPSTENYIINLTGGGQRIERVGGRDARSSSRWWLTLAATVAVLALVAIGASVHFGILPKPGTAATPVASSATENVSLDIRGPAGARVFVDDVAWRGLAPTVVTGLAPGPHEIRLELAGRAPIRKRIDVQVGEPVILSEPVPPALASLTLSTMPSGATIRRDGAVVGTTPSTLRSLVPGEAQRFTLERDGFEQEVVEVTLDPGQARTMNVKLTRLKRRSQEPAVKEVLVKQVVDRATEDGFLTLNTVPWCKVSVSGSPLGSTPLFKTKLPPGSHTIRLINEQEGIDVSRDVMIRPNKVTKLDLKLH